MAKSDKDMRRALKLCLEFLQTGETRSGGERHPYTLWCAAVSKSQEALGERLTSGPDGSFRWRSIRARSARAGNHNAGKPKGPTA